MKRDLEGDVVTIPVSKNVVDVFTDKGWDNWSRFEKRGKHLALVGGQPVSDGVYELLRKKL
jgi:hypothetical protein